MALTLEEAEALVTNGGPLQELWEGLAEVAERPRTTSEEHAMARTSALYTVQQLGCATVADVVRQQRLCEIRARLALQQLVEMGACRRQGAAYVSTEKLSI